MNTLEKIIAKVVGYGGIYLLKKIWVNSPDTFKKKVFKSLLIFIA